MKTLAVAAGLVALSFTAAEAGGHLPDLEGRTVVVVTENAYPPLQFVDPASGDAIGWEYDAMAAIAEKMGLTQVMQNVLGLMAEQRRLFVLPQSIQALRAKIADHRGEVTAEVVSAKALTKAQSDKLAKTLADKFGKNITIQASVDESIIGGLIVKVGSKMIDTSIAAKLNSLQNAMKEVG